MTAKSLHYATQRAFKSVATGSKLPALAVAASGLFMFSPCARCESLVDSALRFFIGNDSNTPSFDLDKARPRPVAARKASVTAVPDPFIVAIEAIKHSVGAMDCVALTGADTRFLKRIGSAFLISRSGDFLTAAHVVMEMQKGDDSCPTPAITFAVGDWRPYARAEEMLWFRFKTADCRVYSNVDVAECSPAGGLSPRIRKLDKAVPVQFEWNIQPDTTPIAFAGFPLEARDPMTFRAHVAAYRLAAPQMTPELVLDHDSLPGFSGAPVFLADGKVVAILLRDGMPEAPGIAIARPVSALRGMLTKTPER